MYRHECVQVCVSDYRCSQEPEEADRPPEAVDMGNYEPNVGAGKQKQVFCM